MRVPPIGQRREMRVNMTPMIDVVFLLIIFFLVSSHLARQESQMPLPLPTASSGEEIDAGRERVVVNLLADGTIVLSGRRVSSAELRRRLSVQRREAGPDLELRIRSDRGVPFQFVQPILLAVSKSGVSNITFAVINRTPGGATEMRYRSNLGHRDGTLDVAMTPMIDVVFMLLIFFVWTSSFQIAELVLPSSLITQSQGQGDNDVDLELEDLDRVVVRVGWNGSAPSWIVNDVPITSFDVVRIRLQTVAKIKVSLPVLVDPMPAVPLGHVIDVYDIARQAGFQNVQFATPADWWHAGNAP